MTLTRIILLQFHTLEYLGTIDGQIVDTPNLATYMANRKKAITFP